MNSLLGTLNAREKLRGFGSGGAVSIPLNAVVSPNRASVQPVSGASDAVSTPDDASIRYETNSYRKRLLEIQIQTAVDSRTDSAHSATEVGPAPATVRGNISHGACYLEEVEGAIPLIYVRQ